MELTAEAFLAAPYVSDLCGFQIGSGLFSRVYATRDPTKVIKLSNSKADGWPYYALYCLQADRGPYALKVFALRITPTGYAALIERADKTLSVAQQIAREDGDFALNARLNELSSIVRSFGFNASTLWASYPGLRKFLRDLRDNLVQSGAADRDLHDENVMFRFDGSLVIIDPVSHLKDGAPVIESVARGTPHTLLAA